MSACPLTLWGSTGHPPCLVHGAFPPEESNSTGSARETKSKIRMTRQALEVNTLPSCRVRPTRLAGKLGTQYTSSPPLMPHNKAAAALPHHTTCSTSRQTIPHPHKFVGHTESFSLCAMHGWTEGITLQCTPPLNVWHTHHINTHGTLQSDTVVAQSQTNQL